jgi:hypothetical protein
MANESQPPRASAPGQAYAEPAAGIADEPLAPLGSATPKRAAGEVMRRLDRALHHGICHFADQLDDLGSRLESLGGGRLQRLGGGGERAAEAAEAVSGWLGSTAEYLRTTEMDDLRGDLEERVRTKPLQTLAASAVAGWVLGKIVK